MVGDVHEGRGRRPRSPAGRRARAWLALTCTLAIHVADDALTGFLDFYNPLVTRIRSEVWWFPMPTFTFGVWLSGLAALVAVLLALTPAVGRDMRGTRFASWALS